MLRIEGLEYIELFDTIIIKARELVYKYRLKPRDAIHAATAITAGEREVISNDKDLDAVKELKRIPIEEYTTYG